MLEAVHAERPWAIGRLLKGVLDSIDERFFRVIYSEVGATRDPTIYLIEIDPNSSPDTTSLPQAFDAAFLKERLRPVPECFRTVEMGWSDDELAKERHEAMGVRDAHFKRIRDLVDHHALPLLMDRRTRAEAINQASEEFGVSESTIRKHLTRFWRFGCDANALLPLHSLKGGPGQVRLHPGEEKRGRRNAYAEEDRSSKYRGTNFDEYHQAKLIEALHLFWTKGKSLAETYRQMEARLYATKVTRSDGTVYVRKVPASRIPTLGMFYYHARRLIAQLGLRQRNLGSLDHAAKAGSKPGRARDITYGPGDFYDMDATEFGFELRASWPPYPPVGCPTVYFVVDRYSTAIIGFEVEFRAERWEGYRRALFTAFTPKTAMLERLGLSQKGANAWPIYGVPNAIFCDRGPGRSTKALDVLCRELKLEKASPPAKRPDLNGVVESINKRAQDTLANLPGGHTRDSGQIAADRRNSAREESMFDERAFRRMLVSVVHDHNNFAVVTHLLTPEMEGVCGVPQAVFQWGLKNSPIDHHRHVDEAELYARLLPRKNSVAVTNKGVVYLKKGYNSKRLQEWRSKSKEKKPKITVYQSTDPRYLYWRPNPTEWLELVMLSADQKSASNMQWRDMEKWSSRLLKDEILTRHRKRKKSKLSTVASGAVREALKKKRISTKGKSSETVSSARERTSAVQQEERSKQGREYMKQLTRPSTSEEVPLKTIPTIKTPIPTDDDEPSMAELHRRTFK